MQLKQEDINYFEKLQRDYINTMNYYNDLIEHMEGWIPSIKTNEHFLTEGGLIIDIKDIKQTIKNKRTESFILNILMHLQKQYGLSSLTNNMVNKITENYIKYNFTDYQCQFDNLNYNDIVKEVYNKLKINSGFEGRKNEDLKSRITDKMEYFWKNDRIHENNKIIKITDFGFSIDANWNGEEVCLYEKTINNYKDIAMALNYIITDKIEIPKQIEDLIIKIGSWNKRLPLNEFYTTHEVDCLGIINIRFYKNKNLEIKFNSKDSQNKFIKALKGDF